MRSRGFTLFEALVASSLLLVILGALGLLVRSYAGSSRASDAHDSSLAGARLALESLRRDGEAATKWLEPVLGSAVAEPNARLNRVDPEQVRLPEVLPTPVPAFWDPYKPTELVEVYYHMVGEGLHRQVTFSDGSHRSTQVADHLAGFAVTSLADETILVRCSILTIQGNPRLVSGRIPLRCLDKRP